MLSVKHLFGIDCSKRFSIESIDENCYVYLTSRHLIFNQIDYQDQRIIPFGYESEVFQALAISPNRKYFIVGVKTAKKSRIVFFELNQLISNDPIERKRNLLLKENLRSNEILSFTFSNNSKFLLILQFVFRILSFLEWIVLVDPRIICYSIGRLIDGRRLQ